MSARQGGHENGRPDTRWPAANVHTGAVQRDELRERTWLELAEAEAGGSLFAEHASRRLAEGEEQYGTRWAEVGLVRLVDELLEEAADLGAWAVLALQAVEVDRDPDCSKRITSELRAAILLGAHAHHALARARRELTRGEEAAAAGCLSDLGTA